MTSNSIKLKLKKALRYIEFAQKAVYTKDYLCYRNLAWKTLQSLLEDTMTHELSHNKHRLDIKTLADELGWSESSAMYSLKLSCNAWIQELTHE